MARIADASACWQSIRDTERVLRVTVQTFWMALVAAYFCATPVSRLALSLALLLVPIFLTVEKLELNNAIRALRRRGFGARRAVIAGSGPAAKRIYSALLRSPQFGVEPVAFVDEDAQSAAGEVYESSYRRQRSARVLPGPLCPELFRELNASVLVMAASGANRAETMQTAAKASPAGVDTYFVPADFLEPGFWVNYAELDGVMLAHLSRGRKRGLCDTGKRAIDVVGAITALAAFAPLLAVLAVLVKLSSSGPVLFQQERVGKSGRRFAIYKFRTMYHDVPAYGYSPTAGEDPRVTRIGRILRRTSLDELPQLLNVLLGQMSLVGPRPEMPFIAERYDALQRQRLSVKPGMTCLWQLSADRAFLIHENLEYDLYYVRYRSLFMDIAILLHTVIFAARGV
jgi:exopolysaccharide biosynthesis polyprenyl glycosylphosphotransferase